METTELKEQWRKFYQKYFSLELNFADVVIPERPTSGVWRLLIIARGLIGHHVYKIMSRAFPCDKDTIFSEEYVTDNGREATHTYPIWVRDGENSDEQYRNKSALAADPDMTVGQTFLERMLHEMSYFDETGKHLNSYGITLCSGSRHVIGNSISVPYMYFNSNDQKVRVSRCVLDVSNTRGGIREVVGA